MSNLSIERLTAIDVAGAIECLAALADVGLSPAKAVKVFQKQLKDGGETFIAKLDGKVIGTATLLIEQKFIHDGGKVGRIEDVAVHRDHQGRRIGSSLVLHLIDVAKEVGCYKVILNCRPGLAGFYSGLGFRTHDVGMRFDLI